MEVRDKTGTETPGEASSNWAVSLSIAGGRFYYLNYLTYLNNNNYFKYLHPASHPFAPKLA